MIQWTKEPSLLPRVTFGKHRGKPWTELPTDYLKWLVDKSDMDEDTKFTALHHLKQRPNILVAMQRIEADRADRNAGS